MRLLRSAAILALLSAAILFAGCGGTTTTKATPTATATNAPASMVPTPAGGFSTFTSTDGVYALNYPSDWGKAAVSTSPVVNGEVFESPDSASIFVVAPLDAPVAADQYVQFASSYGSGLGGTGTQVSPTTTTTSFAGKTWTEVDGTTTLGGTPSELKAYGTTLGSNSLFLVLIWPTASGSQVNTAYLQPMLNSFTLLKQS